MDTDDRELHFHRLVSIADWLDGSWRFDRRDLLAIAVLRHLRALGVRDEVRLRAALEQLDLLVEAAIGESLTEQPASDPDQEIPPEDLERVFREKLREALFGRVEALATKYAKPQNMR